MAEEAPQQPSSSNDINTRLRDIEEKQRLLKDRVLLVGETLIDQREKVFQEIQEMKKTIIALQDENNSLKSLLHNLAEQSNNSARNEDLMILQRQFDLFRKQK